MAYFKIEKNNKGVMQAKIQVSCKDFSTGKNKIFSKRIYNTDNLTEAKFRKFVERESFDFESKILDDYNEQASYRTRILTFAELTKEWKVSVKANLSHNYLLKIEDVENKFNKYLKQKGLFDKPISEIKVRDVQLFLNEYLEEKKLDTPIYRLKRDLPVKIKIRDLKHSDNISGKRAKAICEQHDLFF